MFKRLWIKHVALPRYRRRLRDGLLAIRKLNEMMIRARVPRQRRRHVLRDLERDPRMFERVAELLGGDA